MIIIAAATGLLNVSVSGGELFPTKTQEVLANKHSQIKTSPYFTLCTYLTILLHVCMYIRTHHGHVCFVSQGICCAIKQLSKASTKSNSMVLTWYNVQWWYCIWGKVWLNYPPWSGAYTHTHAGGSKKGEGNQELDTGSMLDHTHTHTDHSGHCDGNLLVPIRQFGEDECEMYHQSMCFGKTQTLYETLCQWYFTQRLLLPWCVTVTAQLDNETQFTNRCRLTSLTR